MSLAEAVDQTRKAHITAVNAGDVEASVNQFLSDAVFLPRGAPALKGAVAMRGWFRQVFGMFNVQGFNIQPSDVEHMGNLAIEHGNWSATFQPKDGPAGVTSIRSRHQEPASMSEQDNVRAVEAVYAAFGRGDLGALLDTLAEDVVWQHPGHGARALAGRTAVTVTPLRRMRALRSRAGP